MDKAKREQMRAAAAFGMYGGLIDRALRDAGFSEAECVSLVGLFESTPALLDALDAAEARAEKAQRDRTETLQRTAQLQARALDARRAALEEAAEVARTVAGKYKAPAGSEESNRPERYGALEAWDAIRALAAKEP